MRSIGPSRLVLGLSAFVLATQAVAYVPPMTYPDEAPATGQGQGQAQYRRTGSSIVIHNPDRFPSLGIVYSGMSSGSGTDTTHCALCNPDAWSQPLTQTGSWVSLDLRLPVTGTPVARTHETTYSYGVLNFAA